MYVFCNYYSVRGIMEPVEEGVNRRTPEKFYGQNTRTHTNTVTGETRTPLSKRFVLYYIYLYIEVYESN